MDAVAGFRIIGIHGIPIISVLIFEIALLQAASQKQ